MSIEYTLDTKRVRRAYIEHVDYWAKLHGLDSDNKHAGTAFDRWLETVRAEAKAEAWDECDDAWEQAHKMSHHEPWEYMKDNPYKETE